MVSHSVTSHKDERGAARPTSEQASITAAESVVLAALLRQKLDPHVHIRIFDHDWWARHGAQACGGCGWAGFALDKAWWVPSFSPCNSPPTQGAHEKRESWLTFS
jgi:hypothetical protein